MSVIYRGDVVLVGFHNAQEKITIRRPAVVLSVDIIKNEVAVLPLSGRDDAGEKGLRISEKSYEGKGAGLRKDVTIDCRWVAKIPATLVVSRIGRFDENIMQKLDKLLNK